LDTAVLGYFESMTFLPGAVDGKPIDTKVTVPVRLKPTTDEPKWVSR
jgi:hypothetical protein